MRTKWIESSEGIALLLIVAILFFGVRSFAAPMTSVEDPSSKMATIDPTQAQEGLELQQFKQSGSIDPEDFMSQGPISLNTFAGFSDLIHTYSNIAKSAELDLEVTTSIKKNQERILKENPVKADQVISVDFGKGETGEIRFEESDSGPQIKSLTNINPSAGSKSVMQFKDGVLVASDEDVKTLHTHTNYKVMMIEGENQSLISESWFKDKKVSGTTPVSGHSYFSYDEIGSVIDKFEVSEFANGQFEIDQADQKQIKKINEFVVLGNKNYKVIKDKNEIAALQEVLA